MPYGVRDNDASREWSELFNIIENKVNVKYDLDRNKVISNVPFINFKAKKGDERYDNYYYGLYYKVGIKKFFVFEINENEEVKISKINQIRGVYTHYNQIWDGGWKSSNNTYVCSISDFSSIYMYNSEDYWFSSKVRGINGRTTNYMGNVFDYSFEPEITIKRIKTNKKTEEIESISYDYEERFLPDITMYISLALNRQISNILVKKDYTIEQDFYINLSKYIAFKNIINNQITENDFNRFSGAYSSIEDLQYDNLTYSDYLVMGCKKYKKEYLEMKDRYYNKESYFEDENYSEDAFSNFYGIPYDQFSNDIDNESPFYMIKKYIFDANNDLDFTGYEFLIEEEKASIEKEENNFEYYFSGYLSNNEKIKLFENEKEYEKFKESPENKKINRKTTYEYEIDRTLEVPIVSLVDVYDGFSSADDTLWHFCLYLRLIKV